MVLVVLDSAQTVGSAVVSSDLRQFLLLAVVVVASPRMIDQVEVVVHRGIHGWNALFIVETQCFH